MGGGSLGKDDDMGGSTASGEDAAMTGGAVLMDAFAKERTGRLCTTGGLVLYLYGGQVPWAEPAGGDAEIFRELVAERLLPPDARPEPVPKGQLLRALVAAGSLFSAAIFTFMRRVVADAFVQVAAAPAVEVQLADAPAFPAHPPPFRINPFGLLVEAGRRQRRADEVLGLSRELRDSALAPGPGLDAVASTVVPFLRGADVRSLVSEGATLRSFSEAAGLDELLATQLVLALEAAGLVHVQRAAPLEGS
jgi:hypothetical protein